MLRSKNNNLIWNGSGPRLETGRPVIGYIPIVDEVAHKVRDTLAGLLAASVNATVDEEKQFARKCCRSRRLRVVLHLEQPEQTSKLFPRPFDPANVQLKLRTLLKGIDPHSRVVDRGSPPALMGWQVELAP